MYPVSDSLKQRVRGSHERRTRFTVLDTNLRRVPGGRVSPDAVAEGSVFVSGGSGARRTARLNLTNPGGIHTPSKPDDLFYWNRLVKVEQGIILEAGDAGSAEWVPIGTFMIDRPGVTVERGGITMLSLNVRDRWKMIDKAQYSEPTEYTSGQSVQTALRAAAEFAGVPSNQIIVGGTTRNLATTRYVEEGDLVGEFMTRLADSFALRVYFDVSGYLVIEDKPEVSALSVAHHYQPGSDSIVTEIKRDLTDERFANHIVVSSASADPEAPPAFRAVAEDDRTNSPTAVSEIGRRTRRYSSPMIPDQTTAQQIADLMLSQFLRFSEETSLKAVGLPYLDADDRVRVSHTGAGLSRNSYLVESMDLPILGAESSLRLTAAHDV